MLTIKHCARLKVYLISLIVQRCNCSSVDAIECLNTYANSVIESSFALMKFMEVIMNVYISRIVSTVNVSKCIFRVNEQQKV